MNFKFAFTLTDECTDEEFIEGDCVELLLDTGEIVRGYLEYTDCLSLTLDRRYNSEEYGFDEIKNMKKVI